MLSLIKSPVLRQFAVVIIANLPMIDLGLSIVWPSPMLIKLRDENQTILSRPVTEKEEPWVVVIGIPFGVASLLIMGNLMNWLGRRKLLLLGYILKLVMSFIFIFGTEVWMVFLGRIVACLAHTITLSVVPTYASEVAGPKIRGASGTLTQIMSALGMMIMFAVGPFVSYLAVNIMMTCILVITFTPMLFIPESPYYLNAKGRTREAEDVLTFLRGTNESALQEIKEYSIKTDETKFDIWLFIKDKVILKTTAMVFFLSVGLQMIGYNAINYYLQSIFESTQTSVSSEISSLIIGLIQLLACFCPLFLSDRFGRKPILCLTLIGMSLGMFGLATFFVIFENGGDITGFLNFLPLLSVAVVIFGYNAGMGSLFYMLAAELYDGRVRPFGVSAAIFVTCTVTFFLGLYFPSMTNSMGASNTYWMFGGICIIVCLFILFLVPETKRKSYVEIQRALGRKGLDDYSLAVEEKVESR